MKNDDILFVISTLTLVTLVSIWAGLRYRKAEVDDVLTEHKVSQSNQTSPQDFKAGENRDLTASSPNNFQTPETVQPIENLPVDGNVLIDYNILHNYSDNLGYWISQFDFVIDYISIPLVASVIGYTCMVNIAPVELAQYKPYAFVSSLITLPVNAKMKGKVYSIFSPNIEDKKQINELKNLFLESSVQSGKGNHLESHFITSLEKQLVMSMSDRSRAGRITQYRWIKDYIKDHQISEKSLFNIYLNVLELKEFCGVKCSEKLNDSEAKFAAAIRKMISYTYVVSDKKV